MRIALAIALAFVSTSALADIAPPPRPRLEPPVKKKKRVEPPTTLVGVVGEDGVERCLADWKSEWIDLYPVIGFTPLKPNLPLDVKALLGKLVVARGKVDPAGLGRRAPVKHEGECPAMQMRSDWVTGPHGIRVMRSGMGTVGGAFVVDDLQPFDDLSVRVEGDELVVTLENGFSVPLVTAVLHVHYEGCFGKPGTTRRSVGTPELLSGEKLVLRAPLIAFEEEGRPGRRTFAASSVQVETHATTVAFDLDWPLTKAGVSVECPKNER